MEQEALTTELAEMHELMDRQFQEVFKRLRKLESSGSILDSNSETELFTKGLVIAGVIALGIYSAYFVITLLRKKGDG